MPRYAIGWYRKHFWIDSENAGKRIFSRIDTVYQNSEVWINGHLVGKRPYGYVSFYYDITPYVHPAQDNVIAVKVDNTVMPTESTTGDVRRIRRGRVVLLPNVRGSGRRVCLRGRDNRGYHMLWCWLCGAR
jgi:hypothetical protein